MCLLYHEQIRLLSSILEQLSERMITIEAWKDLSFHDFLKIRSNQILYTKTIVCRQQSSTFLNSFSLFDFKETNFKDTNNIHKRI